MHWVAWIAGGLMAVTVVAVVRGRVGLSWAMPMPIVALALIIADFRLRYWRCPRCGEHFFSKWWYGNPLARRCAHCGLPKYAAGP
jgi:hypothetical protein